MQIRNTLSSILITSLHINRIHIFLSMVYLENSSGGGGGGETKLRFQDLRGGGGLRFQELRGVPRSWGSDTMLTYGLSNFQKGQTLRIC